MQCLKIKFTLFFIFQITFIFSQSVNWTINVDITKNGFIHDSNVFEDIKSYQYDIYADEYGNFFRRYVGNEGIPIRIPKVYTKSNQRQILIWSDTKERITEEEYDGIIPMALNTYLVKKNNLQGIIDSVGKIIIPIKWENIYSLDPQYYSIINGCEGNEICKYEVNLFACYDQFQKNCYAILRDGTILLKSSSITVDYFVNNKTIYTIYSMPGYTSSVGKLWEKPNLNFNFSFFTCSKTGLINPLIQPVDIAYDKSICFDFSTFRKIPINLESYELKILGKNIVVSSFNKASQSFNEMLIRDDIKNLIPFELNYASISPFITTYGDNLIANLMYEKDDNELFKELFQNDSIFVVKKEKLITSNNKNFKQDCVGLYKIGRGEIIPTKYKSIRRISLFLCIVEKVEDNSLNIIDIRSQKELFKYNFDNIYVQPGNVNEGLNPYLECILNGKSEKYFLNNNEEMYK
jgi:hypothetical protein